MNEYMQLFELMICSIGFSIALAPKLELSPIQTGFLCAATTILLGLCFGK